MIARNEYNPPRRFRPRRRRGGFSFTEILFAVMILGIGFIMVAAMFPVAIRQTDANNQETIAASVGRQGNSFLNQIANVQVISPFPGANGQAVTSSVLLPTFLMPPPTMALPTGQASGTIPGAVWSFADSRDTLNVGVGAQVLPHAAYLWQLIAKNMIQATDQRFAWVAMYKRDYVQNGRNDGIPPPTITPAPYAQIILIGTQTRVKQAYSDTYTDPTNDVAVNPSPLLPVLYTGVSITSGSQVPAPTITFPSSANPQNVGENAFVVISTDGLTTNSNLPPGYSPGMYNGRIYRIGIGSGNTWSFAPGEGPGANDLALSNASVFVVGRAHDPTSSSPTAYAGNSQDVSVYTTFVQTR